MVDDAPAAPARNVDPEPGHNRTIRILLADDQAMIRSGLRLILEDQPDLSVEIAAWAWEHRTVGPVI